MSLKAITSPNWTFVEFTEKSLTVTPFLITRNCPEPETDALPKNPGVIPPNVIWLLVNDVFLATFVIEVKLNALGIVSNGCDLVVIFQLEETLPITKVPVNVVE